MSELNYLTLVAVVVSLGGCFTDPVSDTSTVSDTDASGSEDDSSQTSGPLPTGDTEDTEDTEDTQETMDTDAGICGDGVLDPGEECDDGNDDNTDACTTACAPPSCDDGLVSGDESDEDCGGSCGGCEDGQACVAAEDCGSQSCYAGACVAACESFQRQAGTELVDAFYGVAAGVDGSVYAAGETHASFDGMSIPQGNDVLFVKYDAAGEQIYARQFGTAGSDFALSLAVDPAGNLAMGGNTDGSFPGFTLQGNNDGFVALYDENTTQQWVTQVGTISNDSIESVAMSEDGKVYAVGTVGAAFGANQSQGDQDLLVLKFDDDGTILWSRQLGSSANDRGRAVVTASNGDVIVAGSASWEFEGNEALGAYDVVVARLSSDGSLEWTTQTGTPGWEDVRAIGVDADGAAYVGGATADTMPGQTSGGLLDIYVMKFDVEGQQEWVTQVGTSADDQLLGIGVDANNSVYFTGNTAGELGGPVVGAEDIYVGALDSSGGLQWIQQVGSDAGDTARALSVGPQGEVFVAGFTVGDLAGPSEGEADVFLMRACAE